MSQSKGTIYCACGGTRGDQQPVVMVAAQLKKMGYKIVLAVGPEGKQWTATHGFDYIEFVSFEKVVRETESLLHAAENNDFATFVKALAETTAENMEVDLRVLWSRMKVDKECVGLLVTSTHATLAELLGRLLGITAAGLWLSPVCPTKDFPPYIINLQDPKTWQAFPGMEDVKEYPGEAVNRDVWVAMLKGASTSFDAATCVAMSVTGGEAVMPPTEEGRAQLMFDQSTSGPPNPQDVCARTSTTLYAYSDVIVNGGPSDYTPSQKENQIGYIFDTANTDDEESLSKFDDNLEAFLANGDKPVYIGWGSMARKNNAELLRAAISGCRKAEKRGVILYGWAHLEMSMLDSVNDAELIDYANDKIIIVKDVSHIKLFPECCCLITHGGAGTTAAMLRSGVPSAVTPVWWDQTFFGDRLEAMGMGRRGPHFASVSGDDLAELIRDLTSKPSYASKAKEVSAKMLSQKNADEAAATIIHSNIKKRKAADIKKQKAAGCCFRLGM